MVPDRVAAREWGRERFPDQSQVNLFLRRMTAENLAQLEHAHQELLRSHSLLRSAERVVIDFDQTGLRVTGKRFEFAEKGYFLDAAHKRRRVHLSVAGMRGTS